MYAPRLTREFQRFPHKPGSKTSRGCPGSGVLSGPGSDPRTSAVSGRSYSSRATWEAGQLPTWYLGQPYCILFLVNRELLAPPVNFLFSLCLCTSCSADYCALHQPISCSLRSYCPPYLHYHLLPIFGLFLAYASRATSANSPGLAHLPGVIC